MLRIIPLVLLLAGCGGLSPYVPDAATMKAVPSGGGLCSSFVGPWGQARFVYVNAERGSLPNGTITVDPNTCAVTMNNEPVPKPVPVTIVAPSK